MSKVHARTGRSRVVFIGSSGVNGTGAGDSGSPLTANAWARSFPNRFAQLLSDIPATSEGFAGLQGQSTIAAFGAIDTRISATGSWAASVVAASGGGFAVESGTSAGTLSLTPRIPFDSIEIRSIQFSGGATTVNVDGGASLGTVTSAGSLGATIQTLTCALGMHTINFVHAAVATTYITHIIPYNSTAPGIDVVQCGITGAPVSSFLTNTSVASILPALVALAGNLYVIQFGANDMANGVTVATFGTNLQTLITAVAAVGSVMVMTDAPQSLANWTNGTSALYFDKMRGLAATNNIPMLRLGGTAEPSRWGTYALANAQMPYGDTFHPGALGYWDIAEAVKSIVRSGGGSPAPVSKLGAETIATDAAFTLTPLFNTEQVFHTGTLTADRALTLSTTGAYPGAKFRLARSGGGAFNITNALKNLATNTWAEFAYTGSAWSLSAYGAL